MHNACTSGQQLTNVSAEVVGNQAACTLFSSDNVPERLAVSSMQILLKCEQGLQAILRSVHLVQCTALQRLIHAPTSCISNRCYYYPQLCRLQCGLCRCHARMTSSDVSTPDRYSVAALLTHLDSALKMWLHVASEWCSCPACSWALDGAPAAAAERLLLGSQLGVQRMLAACRAPPPRQPVAAAVAAIARRSPRAGTRPRAVV